MTFNVTQPLLRDFKTDSNRTNLLVTRKQREITDVALQQTIVQTTRQVRNAYWELVYARANLSVAAAVARPLAPDAARQPDARRSRHHGAHRHRPRRSRSRAQRRNRDSGRRADRSDRRQPAPPDLRPGVARLLDDQHRPDRRGAGADRHARRRHRGAPSRRRCSSAPTWCRRASRSKRPISTSASSRTSCCRPSTPSRTTACSIAAVSRPTTTPENVVSDRSWGGVVERMFARDAPRWTVGVQVSYPLGRSTQQVNLARARLQQTQSQLNLKDQELSGGRRSAQRGPQRQHQPPPRRGVAGHAHPLRASARGGAEEVRGRSVHQLRSGPGPARPRQRAQQRAAGDHRLRAVARRLRRRPARRHQQRQRVRRHAAAATPATPAGPTTISSRTARPDRGRHRARPLPLPPRPHSALP